MKTIILTICLLAVLTPTIGQFSPYPGFQNRFPFRLPFRFPFQLPTGIPPQAANSYSGSSENAGSSATYNMNGGSSNANTNTNSANPTNPIIPTNPTFSQSIAEFTIQFYEAITSGNSGNTIMSPFSAQTALSLLYCGSAGTTTTMMANALDFQNQNQTAITNQFQNLLSPLQTNPTLNIANALYVMDGYKIQQSFLSKATNSFFAKVANIDFSQNVAAANTINTWVADETHDKIENLISASDLDSDTRAVLLNAIYFKGTWLHTFPAFRTQPTTFNITSQSSVQVPMMHVTANYNYNFVNELNAQVIELPYNNSDVTMVLILPQDVDGLSTLQKAFKTFDLAQLDSQLYSQKVILSMPKFTIETTLNLNGPLTAMGLGTIFESSADFSKMLTNSNGMVTPLVVSKVVQKAYIDVDETGATAAAATGIIGIEDMIAGPPPPPPVVFNADHPFIFLLKTPGSTLFIGTYNALQ